jgi:hypothetical protein
MFPASFYSQKSQVWNHSVTFAEWKKNGDANPIWFEELTPSMMSRFRDAQVVLARKFRKGALSEEDWRRIVTSEDVTEFSGKEDDVELPKKEESEGSPPRKIRKTGENS